MIIYKWQVIKIYVVYNLVNFLKMRKISIIKINNKETIQNIVFASIINEEKNYNVL